MAAPTLTTAMQRFACDVRDGLLRPQQKELPSVYLYDEIGTALFETITLLPEYGLTRADERLLRNHAHEIAGHLPPPVLVAELGSGSGRKAHSILEALAGCAGPLDYHPIDVSRAALDKCRAELSGRPGWTVGPVEGPYIEGLLKVVARRRPGETVFVLFLGSTIGNFSRDAAVEFLGEVRRALAPGDMLLVGADLVKPAGDLLLAYDDPAGVTAAFNLNLLARINRELGGNFVLRNFAHQARFDRANRRIEMHLVSRRRQSVAVRAAAIEVSFKDGESIWTEACHKFSLPDLDQMACAAGFSPQAQWVDRDWPFAECLWTAVR